MALQVNLAPKTTDAKFGRSQYISGISFDNFERLLATQYGILLYGRGWRKPTTKAPAIRWRNQECFAGSPLCRGDSRQREAIGRARTEKMKTAPCR